MAASTWSWIGGSGGGTIASNWTLIAGTGNATGVPTSGDTAIESSGTIQLHGNLIDNILELGGTAGTIAALTTAGDGTTGPGAPTFDSSTTITTSVPGQTTAETSLLNAGGNFVNAGTILAAGPAGSALTVNIASAILGGTTYAGQFDNAGLMVVDPGNTLTVAAPGGGTFGGPGTLAVSGGSALISATLGGAPGQQTFTIAQGGSLEIASGGSNDSPVVVFDGPGTLKLDQPGAFTGTIDFNSFGGTIDLGVLNVTTITFDANGNLSAIGSGGGTVFAPRADWGDLSGLANWGSDNGTAQASFPLSATGGVAGYLVVTEGNGGDTLLTAAGPSTWSWKNGASAAANIRSDWSLVSGPGNGFGNPNAGDTAIDAGGTIVLGNPTLTSNTVEAGGTVSVAAVVFEGDSSVNFGNSSIDQNSIIDSAVPGNTTAESTLLSANGYFVNEGTILANGPAASTFTIAIGTTSSNGTTEPGYFYNSNLIQADGGNTLTIAIGATSELFNSGTILADGGTVKITVNPSAIAGGDAPVRGFEEIEGGGTLETAAYSPASDGNNGTHTEIDFVDSAPGNTLKIDNVGSFDGNILGFAAGDTIDLGTLLSVGSVAFNIATGLLGLEAANGTTLATLLIGNTGTGWATGTFAVVNGTADGLTFGVGADGDTVLTTSVTRLNTSGTSGTWQSPTSWAGGVIPGTNAASASIGIGATAPFTLTTGSTPVSVGGFGIDNPLATVQITSDTTLTNSSNTGSGSDFSGTLDVTTGNTLTAGAVQLYEPTASFTIAAGATADLAGRVDTDLAPVGGVWAMQPGQNPYAFSVSAGTAVVDGALLAGPTASTRGGDTGIGYESAGTPAVMIVNPGATVTDTHTTMGSDPTSSGTLIIDGATWTDMIDNQDTFNSRGNMTVGYDDVALNTPAGTTAPQQVAPAMLTVENSGTLTEQVGASIASTEDSAGQVTIETGGVWNIGSPGSSSGIGVGSAGSGTLSVLNGGTVNIYTGGTFLSNGTTYTSGGIGLGNSAGASGTVVVSGAGSLLDSANGMSVGKLGQGFLDILNGGTVLINAGGISVAQTTGAGSSGTLTVGGTGAAAALNFATGSGGLTVGNGSGDHGTVTVADNGTINLNGTGYLTIGSPAGAFGTMTVGGTAAGAVINIGTAGLTVGNSGSGYATVSSLGSIHLTGTGYLTIGGVAGGYGSLTVSGAAASAAITIGAGAGLTAGSSGTGALTIGAGGTITNSGSYSFAGSNTGGIGTITVSGAGALLNGSAAVIIGNSGTGAGFVGNGGVINTTSLAVGQLGGSAGTLTVQSGGTVLDSGLAVVGNQASSTGQLIIQTGGSISLTGTASGATIGGSGSGTLTLNAGSSLSDSGSLTIGGQSGGTGTVTVSGGTITAAEATVGSSGSGVLTISNGGEVSLTTNTTSSIGTFSGAKGTVTVTGAGSRLQGQYLLMGQAGQSVLNTQNGGSVGLVWLGLGGNTSPLGGNATVSATGGAQIETGALYLWQGSTISADSGSGIDVGTSGSYVNGAINLETGRSIVGNGLIAAAVVNNGLIEASNATAPNGFTQGTLEIQGSITGSGVLQTGTGILRLDTAPSSGQAIQFGTGSELILNVPGTTLSNAITGLSDGDKIDLNLGAGVSITKASVTSPGTVTIVTNTGSYTLTNVSFAAGSATSFYWGTDPSNGDADIQVATPYINWTGTAGDTLFSDSGNWQGGQVPNATEGASIVNNPGTITGVGGALDLSIGPYNQANAGTWFFNGVTLTVAGQPNAPYPPFGVGFYANTVLNGGTLNAGGGGANIGNVDGVTVTAQGGAKVTTLDDNIGTNTGQSGSLYLTGAGTTWSELAGPAVNGYGVGYLTVGYNAPANGQAGGAGFVTVTNNATLNTGESAGIGSSTGSYGSVTVSSGGAWTLGQGLSVGGSGSGTLAISGGIVTAGQFVGIAQNTGGEGSVTLTNAGLLTAQNGLQVGQNGAGTLAVSGGTVNASNYVGIGQNAGAEGTVSVTNAGIFNAGSALTVGALGAGTLTVTGGTVVTTGGLSLGGNAGAIGVASLTGGIITAAGGIQVGQSGDGTLTVGAGGTLQFGGTFNPIGANAGGSGLLQILNGGTAVATTASSNTPIIEIGNTGTSGTLAAAAGNVLVSGVGSLLNLNGNGMLVGTNGDGDLTVSGGGTVEAGVLNSNSASAFQSGNSIGSMGSILITGTGSALNLAGAVLVGRGGSSNLTVSNDGQMNITTSPSASSALQIGIGNPSNSFALGGNGEVTVTSGGTLNVNSNNITIGGEGAAGVLNVNSGGLVSSLTGFTLGMATAVSGTVYGGTGSLNIGPGGTVSVTEAPQTNNYVLTIGNTTTAVTGPATQASGVVAVSGAGALLTTNNNGIAIGRYANGVLTVSQGGTVVVGTQNTNNLTAFGVGQYADGSLVLTDAGTEMISNGGAFFGRAGAATGLIENHATLLVNNDTSNSGNYGFSIGSANGGNNTTQTSVQAGGSGDVQVTTSADVNSVGTITVGRSGTGALEVNTGGTVEAAQQIAIGTSETVSAGGSIISSFGTTILSSASILAGTGIVTVGAAGMLKADGTGFTTPGTSDLIIGWSTLASGTLKVTGAGAIVNTNGFGIDVGSSGNGTMLVSLGGTVLAATPFAADQAIRIGGVAGGSGALTVTDPGSSVQAKGQLSVGLSGIGSLLIENQATVTAGNNAVDTSEGFDIGQNAGASGNATVTGVKSLLSNTGRFVVGDGGLGELAIGGGGTVVTSPGAVTGLAGLAIANTAGASGSGVSVSGTGSQLTIAGLAQVGVGGAGSLQIANGAAVTAGSLDVGVSAAASANIGLSGAGTSLTLTGAATIGDAGSGELSILNGASFAATGLVVGAQGAGSGVVTVGGGGVLNLTLSGSITLGDGTGSMGSLIVTSGGTVIDAGATLTGTGTVGIATGAQITGAIVASTSGETIANLGTVGGAVTLSGGDRLVTGAGAVFSGGISGGGGNNTLEISSGPYALTNFDVAGSVQYSALQIDGGVTVTSDSSNLWTGQKLTDAGTFVNEATLANAVTLTGAGALDNLAGETVTGTVTATAKGETVSNLGTISGPVVLAGGDKVVTGAGAAFSGGIAGGTGGNTLEIASGPYTLTGFDAPGSTQYTTLQIDAGVIVTVDTTDVMTGVSLINGGTLNLGAFEATTSLQNSGEITGAITLASGVPLTNSAGGTISGTGLAVIEALGPASVMNSGVIDPSPFGVQFTAGGTFTTAAGATTEGTNIGVSISGGAGTVTNAGTITGDTGDAVTLAAGFANRVIMIPGAVFNGVVDGGNTIGASNVSTLELAAAGITGILNGFGTNFVNFAQVQLDQGATWSLAGSNSLAAGTTLTDQGVLQLSGQTATGGAVIVANTAGLAASGTVSGGVWSGMTQLIAGGAGTGSYLVSNAGTASAASVDVAASAGASGTITVTGADSLLSGGGVFTVGDAGSGSLTIAAGGTVTSATGAVIANAATSTSSASLAGAGSNWQVTGSLVVGDAGNGALTLAQGTTVNATSLTLAATAGSGGVVTASGAGTSLGVTGSTTIGNEGGVLLILTGAQASFGATVTDQDQVIVGGASATGGAVTVASTAGITASGTVTGGVWSGISQLVVGGAGAGSFLVNDTGTAATAGVDLAASVGGSGTLTVTGVKSLLSNTGSFIVGDNGGGSLAIGAGGTVTTAGGAIVANTTNGAGSAVDVSGTGSEWQVGGLLDVGVTGSGGLQIGGGATVTAGSLDAANVAAAVGQVTVTDPGSELIVAGSATVSDDGTGVLSVLNGASFSAQSLTIGNQGDSSGALVVSGNNTTLTVSGSLNIGTALGTGDLTVGPGAVVNASVVNLQGGVVLEGGVLDPTVYIENGGSTTGGFGTVSSQFILLEGTILSNGSKSGKQTEVVQGTVVGGGTATISGSVSVNGPGILQIGTHDTIELTGAVLNAATTTFTDNLTPTGTYTVNNSVIDVVFQDSTGVLQLDDIAGFAGTVATWKGGDSFVITGGTLSNLAVSNGNTLTFSDAGTGAGTGGIDTIIFGSGISANAFNIVNGNTVQAVACFAEGTRIGTADGWVAVEDLSLGDYAITNDDAREPIVWIGQRTVNCRAHPDPATVWPVRVRRGAFGENVPRRDLYLSPDHAVFVNGVLVPVKLLLNGTSIAQVQRNRVTYYHVELPSHSVILAEGLPVESYLDVGDRADFHQNGETIRLFANFAARLSPETALLWETRGAARLVMAGPELAAARGSVIENAAQLRSQPMGPISG